MDTTTIISDPILNALQFCRGNPRFPTPPTKEEMKEAGVKPSLRGTVDYVVRLREEIMSLRKKLDDAEGRIKASEKTCAEQAHTIGELQRTRITIKNLTQQTPRKQEICGAKMQVEIGGARFIVICGEAGTEEHGFRCVNHQCFAPALPLASDFVEVQDSREKVEAKPRAVETHPKASYAAAAASTAVTPSVTQQK